MQYSTCRATQWNKFHILFCSFSDLQYVGWNRRTGKYVYDIHGRPWLSYWAVWAGEREVYAVWVWYQSSVLCPRTKCGGWVLVSSLLLCVLWSENFMFPSLVVLTWQPNGGTKFCPPWLSLAEKCVYSENRTDSTGWYNKLKAIAFLLAWVCSTSRCTFVDIVEKSLWMMSNLGNTYLYSFEECELYT